MGRYFEACAQVATVALFLDWTAGAIARSGQLDISLLWLSACAGLGVYLVGSMLVIGGVYGCARAALRIWPAPIDAWVVARGVSLFVFTFVAFNKLDAESGVQLTWFPVAALLAYGFDRWAPPAATLLSLGALATALVALVVTTVPALDLLTYSAHFAVAVIVLAAAWLSTREAAATRSVRRALLGAAGALVLVGLVIPQASRRPERGLARTPPAHNLLLISVDTLRADAVSGYGGPAQQTPAIARAAARGVLFSHAYSAGPWTLPSMASLFSSRHPLELRAGPYSYSVGDQPMLAGRLGEMGARTCAVVANPVVDSLTRGFQSVRRIRPFSTKDSLWVLPVLQALRLKAAVRLGFLPFVDSTASAARATIDCLHDVGRDPFFVWVHFFDPHDPYAPPAKWRLPAESGRHAFFAPNLVEAGDESIEDLQAGRTFGLGEPFWNHLQALYAGEVRHTDAAIGEILSALEALDLAENTFVVITSDHGEEFQEHGGYYHGQSLYDELVHVPLILLGPGISAGRIEESVSLMDVMPTLSELLGLDADPEAEGRSLTSLLAKPGGPFDARPIPLEGTNYGEPRRGMILGRYKLISYMVTGRIELFDLEADPAERRDLSHERPDLVSTLLAHFPSVHPDRVTPREHPLEERRTLERLRALGYVR